MPDPRSLLEHESRRFIQPDGAFERLVRRRDRKRRNQRIAAGVVGIAVFVAAVWVVTNSPFDQAQTPAVPGGAETGPTEALEPTVPAPGIPPDGATPSVPETGDLILSVSGWGNAAEGALTHMYVFADGRLIWSREGDLPEGANGYHTGLVEQRLTPEGVELMRSEVISSGLMQGLREPAHSDMVDRQAVVMVGGEADPDPFPFLGQITVRDADRLIGREFANEGYRTYNAPREDIATAEEERSLERLDARLTDPASWLPASAWADKEIRAYVPSTYRVCYGGMAENIERDRLLHAIPGPGQELLEARDARTTGDFNVYIDFGDWMEGVRAEGFCSDLTTQETRVVVRGLDDGGLKRLVPLASFPFNTDAQSTFEYILPVPDPAGWAAIWIDPYLPHGQAICIPCG